MSKLTKAEKNQIIINEAKGILHPEYYCYTTKSGNIQVRRRKNPLQYGNVENIENSNPPKNLGRPENMENSKNVEDYDSVSNKQLLQMMLEILEKNTISNNQNINDPERERETEDNEEFNKHVRKQISDSDSESETIEEEEEQPKEHIQINNIRRRGRIL